MEKQMPRDDDVVRVYKDRAGEWRWRRRAANGEVISTSSEGYSSYADCKHMAEELNLGVRIAVTNETENF
jgi:uncharacterized protein YegP (UPF0339 family)